jgi:hypothetical protein
MQQSGHGFEIGISRRLRQYSSEDKDDCNNILQADCGGGQFGRQNWACIRALPTLFLARGM